MQYIHQFSFKVESYKNLFQLVENSGILFERVELPNGDSIATVLVDEDHNVWTEFSKWTNHDGVIHSCETRFSKDEVREAQWLRVVNVYSNSYPEPFFSWNQHPNNYNSYCSECGTYIQVSPFLINSEPKFRRHDFLTLHWTGGLLFTKPEIVNVLLENEIKGFEVWPVMLYGSEKKSVTLQQLYVNGQTKPGFCNNGQSVTTCSTCGIAKYEYHRYGKMKYKGSSLAVDADIIRTKEWFGAGHFAYHELLISKRFAELVLKYKWNGFDMKVVELIN